MTQPITAGMGCWKSKVAASNENSWAFKMCEEQVPPLDQLTEDISQFLEVRKERVDLQKLTVDLKDKKCMWFKGTLKEPKSADGTLSCNEQKTSAELFELWQAYCASASQEHRFCAGGLVYYEEGVSGSVVLGVTGVLLLLVAAAAIFARLKHKTALLKFKLLFTSAHQLTLPTCLLTPWLYKNHDLFVKTMK